VVAGLAELERDAVAKGMTREGERKAFYTVCSTLLARSCSDSMGVKNAIHRRMDLPGMLVTFLTGGALDKA
jgi:hypothetical protein